MKERRAEDVYHVGLDLDADQVRRAKRLALEQYTTVRSLLTCIIVDYLEAHPVDVDRASSREKKSRPATQKKKQ